MQLLAGAPLTGADVSSAGNKLHAEIFALWLSDLALARRLDWDAPVPLLATAIAHPSSRRGPSGKRPRPADPDWVDAAAGAYATAAQEAYVLAGELSRRTEKLLAVQSKLRAKGAGRVARTFAGRRRRLASARREIGAAIRSRRPPLVRSAHRVWRRARTLRPAEFSALWTVAFSRKVGTGSRKGM